jgi:hypothetical protein
VTSEDGWRGRQEVSGSRIRERQVNCEPKAGRAGAARATANDPVGPQKKKISTKIAAAI